MKGTNKVSARSRARGARAPDGGVRGAGERSPYHQVVKVVTGALCHPRFCLRWLSPSFPGPRPWHRTPFCPARKKSERRGKPVARTTILGRRSARKTGKTRRRLGARVRGSRARRWPQRRRNPVPTPHARETGECRLTSRASFSSRLRFCERVTATPYSASYTTARVFGAVRKKMASSIFSSSSIHTKMFIQHARWQ